MKTVITLSLLLGFAMVQAQNLQNYHYMWETTNIIQKDKDSITDLSNIPDINQIFDSIKKYQTSTNNREQKIRDSFHFEIAKKVALDSTSKILRLIKENLRKTIILEAAWLKMNNLNPQQNTPMYADIMEMKLSLLEADKEAIQLIKDLKKMKNDENNPKFDNLRLSYAFDVKKYNEIKDVARTANAFIQANASLLSTSMTRSKAGIISDMLRNSS